MKITKDEAYREATNSKRVVEGDEAGGGWQQERQFVFGNKNPRKNLAPPKIEKTPNFLGWIGLVAESVFREVPDEKMGDLLWPMWH